MGCMDDGRSKLGLKEQYRPKTYARRKAVIDLLRPISGLKYLEGRINVCER